MCHQMPFGNLGNRKNIPDSNVYVANLGPTWVLSAPDGPHVGPMNLSGILRKGPKKLPCW